MEKRLDKEKLVLVLIILIFTFVITFFAFSFRMGLSPDSSYHLDVSKAYSTTFGIPQNTPDTYQYRDITRITYLYFWINGRILNINNGGINEIILLRLVNVVYSIGTVYVLYLLSKEVIKDKWKRLLPVFLLTNTLMFVFLSSAINYDNLANLLSVLSILFFVKFVKSKLDIKYFLWMILFLCIGSLTKFTVLPLAAILILLSIIEIFRKRKLLKNIKFGKEYILLLPILLFGFLNIQLYGINLLRYGELEPNCEQILTHEQCLTNGVYYRDTVTFKEREINGLSDTVKLILSGERVDPVRYFFKWLPNITSKVHGIMADSSLYMPVYFRYVYIFFLSIGGVVGIIKWKKWNVLDRYLIAISLFYTSILFFFWNYSMYLRFNHYYLGLQGRYLFPVITVMYILFSKSIFFIKKDWLRYLILIPLIILFIYGCLPFFFTNVNISWFSGI